MTAAVVTGHSMVGAGNDRFNFKTRHLASLDDGLAPNDRLSSRRSGTPDRLEKFQRSVPGAHLLGGSFCRCNSVVLN